MAVQKLRRSKNRISYSQAERYPHSSNIRWLHALQLLLFHQTIWTGLLNLCSLSRSEMLQQLWLTWAQMMNEKESASRKMVETMTSTERCGPRLCNKQVKQSSISKGTDHSWNAVQRSVKAAEYAPWEKSEVTTTSLCSGLSSAWNEESQISLPCELRWGGWSTWQIKVSVMWKKTKIKSVIYQTSLNKLWI